MFTEKIHIGNLGADLVYEPNDMSKRLAALDQLKDIATTEPFTYDTVRSIKSLSAGLYSDSLLVKQKCISAIGQSRYPAVVPILQEQLADKENDIGSRLEAVKGLALLRFPGQEFQTIIELLTVRYDEEEDELLRDGAEVAAARMNWELKAEESGVKDDWFGSVDTAPPFAALPSDNTNNSIEHFSSILLNPTTSLFQRLRAMTSLRNICISSDSTWAPDSTIIRVAHELTRAHQAPSPFLRHQLVLTLGQISHDAAMPYLLFQLQNGYSEDSRVRAAAAEVLGDFTYEKDVVDFMRDFKDDESKLVRECISMALAKVDVLNIYSEA